MLNLLLTILFTFATDDRGLRVAYGNNLDSLTTVGGTVVSSDYGQWGPGKRMHDPYLTYGDGLWRLTFRLDTSSPCYGVTQSRDLLHWKPQDYPMGAFPYGKQEVNANAKWNNGDFVIGNVNGNRQKGQAWNVDDAVVERMKHHFDSIDIENRRNSERMEDDAKRFAGLGKVKARLHISDKSKKISDKLIGIFFEDISYAADGGLYGELIQNRDFEYSKADLSHIREWDHQYGWNNVGKISSENPLTENTPYYIILSGDTLKNYGWDGIRLDKGEKYNLSLWAKAKKTKLKVELVENGTLLASTVIKVKGNAWREYKAVLTAKENADKAELHIYQAPSLLPKGGCSLDIISLFPQNTFHGHGLRKDLAQVIADLHPKFMRFPGGCMTHGDGLDNIYNWKETIGPLKDRKGAPNIWRYHQTRGLGFYEYFQFCEDIGAEPLPVLAAGVPCQNSRANAMGMAGQQGGIPIDRMGEYIQDLLDLIDWANADASTNKWAKMRADAGHPQPFHLKYIGIGNEDLVSDVFTERYLMIANAIHEKHPEIQICGTAGPFHKGSSDYEWGWKIAKENHHLFSLIDEHYYESTGWFMHNQDYYDAYDRTMPKVYLGEYAASTNVKRSNVETALAEAIHLCNVERNGDVVTMTSYAPLLAKDGHNNWNPDLIYFNNRTVRVTPSYETQRMFSIASGDEYVENKIDVADSLKHRIVSSVVRQTRTGKQYVKVVNALPVEVEITLDEALSNAKCMSFSGNINDQHVEPTTDNLSGNVITLKPYSLNIIEK